MFLNGQQCKASFEHVNFKMNLECNTAVEPSLIRSPMCRKKLAVLTGVFFTRKCMAVFARRPKQSGRNNEVTVLPRRP